MKTPRIIQFAAAAALISIGCIVLISNAPVAFAAICLNFSGVILWRRSEMNRAVRSRELWIVAASLAAFAGLVILANHFIPRTAGEHLIHQPILIGGVWMTMMSTLFWRWRKEKRLPNGEAL